MRIRFISFLCVVLTLWVACNLSVTAADKKFVVVIDAGHGGKDPGAVGRKAKEKNINLDVALELGRLIGEGCPDVEVLYTRKTDVFVSLQRRAAIANEAKADLFISIHTNAVPKGRIARGTETYTLGMARADENLAVAKRENSVILVEENYKERYAGFNPNSSESYIMFEFMQDKYMEQSVSLARGIQGQFRNYARRIDKGVHQAGFLVLRATSMPSVLVELGYISTPDEEQYLNSKSGVKSLARSIYNAFLSYKKENHNTHEPIVDVNEDKNDGANKPVEDKAPQKTDVKSDSSTTQPSDNANPAKKEQPTDKSEAGKKEQPSANQSAQTVAPQKTTNLAGQILFKVQFLSSSEIIKTGNSKLKGYKAVYYIEHGLYKYTHGSTTDYDEIVRIKKQVGAKFKDAFVVAFRDGKKMNLKEAIDMYNSQKGKK